MKLIDYVKKEKLRFGSGKKERKKIFTIIDC
jgi:hypothetical protein